MKDQDEVGKTDFLDVPWRSSVGQERLKKFFSQTMS